MGRVAGSGGQGRPLLTVRLRQVADSMAACIPCQAICLLGVLRGAWSGQT